MLRSQHIRRTHINGQLSSHELFGVLRSAACAALVHVACVREAPMGINCLNASIHPRPDFWRHRLGSLGGGASHINRLSFFGSMMTWHYHIRSRHRHVWAWQKMMSGPILKSQEPSWRLASKTGVAPKKPLILTKTTHFQKKSAPAARYGDACGAPTGRGAHYTNL